MAEGISRLAEDLQYTFRDAGLLEQALTHRSAAPVNNERLEFLGDAILSFLVAEALYERLPPAREGRLTRLRAALVRRETLAEVARGLELGALLNLGSGELKSGGRERDSILADALEALVGAIYLDGGMEACRRCVLVLMRSRIDGAAERALEKDPKTHLQEYLQARGRRLPEYTVTRVEGAAHEHSFTVECRVEGVRGIARGHGSSRRGAEQDAARKALELIGNCRAES